MNIPSPSEGFVESSLHNYSQGESCRMRTGKKNTKGKEFGQKEEDGDMLIQSRKGENISNQPSQMDKKRHTRWAGELAGTG